MLSIGVLPSASTISGWIFEVKLMKIVPGVKPAMPSFSAESRKGFLKVRPIASIFLPNSARHVSSARSCISFQRTLSSAVILDGSNIAVHPYF